LWSQLQKQRVFDDTSLERLARKVAAKHLRDIPLPPFQVKFSTRQQKRWGSCTTGTNEGSIRISSRLLGHPIWVLEHLLLHELIHLVVTNHGPDFHALMERCPFQERAGGYLDALETLGMLTEETPDPGPPPLRAQMAPTPSVSLDLPLFSGQID